MSTAAPSSLDPDDLTALEEQRDFLLRSLEDLDREHDAGDLDDDDYATLRDDYTARAAETLRALDQHRAAADDGPPRPGRGRTVLIFAGVALFAVVAGLLVAASIGSRDEGETASGGITTRQTPSQRAQVCVGKIGQGPAEAVTCFQGVLDDDPRNVVAQTWLGWTLELAASSGGLSADQTAALRSTAADLEDRAVEADPSYSYARAFRAVLAYRRGDYAEAKDHLADFRANNPSADASAVIDQMQLETNIAKGLADAAGLSTTTTTTSTTTPSTTPP